MLPVLIPVIREKSFSLRATAAAASTPAYACMHASRCARICWYTCFGTNKYGTSYQACLALAVAS